MKVLTVYAHPNPASFCHAVLEEFTRGLVDAGHASEVVDLYAIRFDPVFRLEDFASYVHESMPLEILERMNLNQRILDAAGGPLRRWIAARWLRGKDAVTLARFIHDFYGVPLSNEDTRRAYLNRAYDLGRGFAQA